MNRLDRFCEWVLKALFEGPQPPPPPERKYDQMTQGWGPADQQQWERRQERKRRDRW